MTDPKPSSAKSSVRQRKKSEAQSTQKYIPIAEIRNDCVLLKNGGIRGVLSVGSMNFSLKSEEEQEAIIVSYQQFLNTLSFPVQIVIRSSKMNVDAYVAEIMSKADKQLNPLLKEQTIDYASFIRRLVDVSDIMQKHFFLIVPVDPPGQAQVSFFKKYIGWLSPGDSKVKMASRRAQFSDMAGQLRDRMNIVQIGLESIGLTADRFSTAQLIELYYDVYNPTTSQNEKLLHPGELHLTSEVI